MKKEEFLNTYQKVSERNKDNYDVNKLELPDFEFILLEQLYELTFAIKRLTEKLK